MSGDYLVCRDDDPAEFPVVDETIGIGVVSDEKKLRLVAIVHFMTNKAVKALREVSLRQVALTAEVENLKGCHAGEVLSVSQFTL